MANPIKLTERLLQKCDEAQNRFFDAREQNKTYDFFESVKPYADKTHEELLEWRTTIEQFIEQHRPKNLYIQQIEHAIEAMEQFIVQSFYQQTSKKRFLQSIQSVKYTLTVVLRKLQEVDEDVLKKTND